VDLEADDRFVGHARGPASDRFQRTSAALTASLSSVRLGSTAGVMSSS